MYVLDSSAIIEIMKNGEACKKICNTLGDAPAITTSLTINELILGAKKIERKVIEKLIDGIEILNLDTKSAIKSADIEIFLKKQGKTINKIDVLIAGMCIVNDKTIITLDKHFTRIPELKSIVV